MNIKEILLKYLRQPSTWQGLTGLTTALGITLSPDQAAAIVAIGIAIVGGIDVFWDTDK